MTATSFLDRTMDFVKVDFSPKHRQPSNLRVIAATAVAIVGSLLIDALTCGHWPETVPFDQGIRPFSV